jgi:hypothetical protein
MKKMSLNGHKIRNFTTKQTDKQTLIETIILIWLKIGAEEINR